VTAEGMEDPPLEIRRPKRDSSQSVAETDGRGGSELTDKAVEGKLEGEAGDTSADWGERQSSG